MGLKSSSFIFQRAMEHIFKDFTNIIIYQDDILLGAPMEKLLDKKARRAIHSLEDKGMMINDDKSILKASQITFLGHKISADGISPDPELVRKIMDIEVPSNRKELNSFLGLANFFGRFIPDYSTLVSPLTDLRKQNVPFQWTSTQENAFQALKLALVSDPVVQPFDVTKECTLTTDASEQSISGIITQCGRPVMYISRKLSETEKRYSNIEREALACVWCMERAKQFLMGTKFLLKTDHRPLEFIFGQHRALPKVTNARIMRWAIKIMAFDFDIIYVKGSNIPHADALTRLRFADNSHDWISEKSIHWTAEETIPWKILQEETARDRLLQDIIKRIQSGRWSNCSQAERPYKMNKHRLMIDDSVICCGECVVVPQLLRRQVLQNMHNETHLGIAATRNRLKLSAWWPGYCQDVENYVSQCGKCRQTKGKNSVVHTWPPESIPWSRVHMDHAYIQDIGLILVLVDAFSGWPEAIRVKDRSVTTVMMVL